MAGIVPFRTQRSSIPYFELPEQGFSIRAHSGPKEAKRTLLVDWPLRDALQADLLPDVEIGGNVVGNGPGGTLPHIDLSFWNPTVTRQHFYYFRRKLLRKDPERHPRYPDLYAWEASVPLGYGYPESDGDSISYRQATLDPATGTGLDGKAKVVVTYKKMPFDHTQDVGVGEEWFHDPTTSEIFRYCSVKVKSAGENLPIETSAARWFWTNEDGRVVGTAPPQKLNKLLERSHFAITWHMVPRVPKAAQYLLGTVNENSIVIPKRNLFGVSRAVCTPGTLLYTSPEISDPYTTMGGREVYDVTYHLIYRPQGWNRFARPWAGGGSGFSYLVRGGAGVQEVTFDTGRGPTGAALLIDEEHCIYPYSRLQELWRIDGEYAFGGTIVGGPGAA